MKIPIYAHNLGTMGVLFKNIYSSHDKRTQTCSTPLINSEEKTVHHWKLTTTKWFRVKRENSKMTTFFFCVPIAFFFL